MTNFSTFTGKDKTFSAERKPITNEQLAKKLLDLTAQRTFHFPKRLRFNENAEDEIKS